MKRILSGMVLCFLSLNLFGQFQFSSLDEKFIVGSDISGHIRHTSCHSNGNTDFADFNSDLYVSTWGEGGSRLHYKRTHAGDPNNVIYEGTVAIPNASIIQDAAILRHPDISSPNKYCVAAIYVDATSGGSIAVYEWTLTGLNLLLNYQFTPNNTYNMSIDAIRSNAAGADAYTVVYESNARLYSFSGMSPVANAFGYPLIGNHTELITDAFAGRGRLPDVALTETPFLINNPSGIKAYFTYIDLNQNLCYVSNYGYDELIIAGTTTPINPEHVVNPMTYLFSGSTNCLPGTTFPTFFYSPGPKIDAPDRSDDSWAVIVGQHEFYTTLANNSPNVCAWPMNMNKMMQLQMTAAYKHNSGPVFDIVLNNGSLSGTTDMSTNLAEPFTDYVNQSQPAVAYGPDGNEIHFGWGKTKDDPAMNDHDYIGLLYNPGANDIMTGPSGEGYRIIDQQADLMPYITSIAFSGHNDNTMNNLYTVFTSSVDNTSLFPEGVYNKHPEWGTIPSNGYKPLNVSNTDKTNALTAFALPNPFNKSLVITVPASLQQDKYEMVIWDLAGRIALRTEGTIPAINQELDKWAKGSVAVNNNYILQLKSQTTRQQTYLKITRVAQ